MHDAALYDDPKLYDTIVRPGPCEPFYRKIADRTGGPILELACGTGRLSLPLAADGHEVVGVDRSPAMLGTAAAKAAGRGLAISFVLGDIRTVRIGRQFALVIISCNSLGHLTSNEDLVVGLANIAEHLAPAGLFAFDIVNPDIRTLARSRAQTLRLAPDTNAPGAIAIEEVAAYDPVRQIRVIRLRVRGPAIGERRIAPLPLRLIFPQELPILLRSAGLDLAARFGDFNDGPFTAASLNQVCLVRRQARAA